MLTKGKLPVKLSADGQAVVKDGRLYRPIDDSGVYYYDDSAVTGVPMPKLSQPLEKVLRRNGFHGMVRCKLVDYVDCSTTSHKYVDSNGRTRVLTLNGEKYRVTAPGGDLSWFAYYMKCNTVAGKPHLVVCQLINDRERHTTVSLSQAEKEPWVAPYQGEENFAPRSMEDSASVRCDVGGTVYTGREFYCDGKPFNYSLIYYPKTPTAKVTVSHHSVEMNPDETGGAAVSKIWVFDIVDPLPAAVEKQPENGRDLAMYFPHSWFFYSHYGYPSRTEEQRVKSLTEMVRYLKFCGFNQIQFHIINGSDVAGAAWYDAKYYNMNQGNLFKELLPIAEKEGMQFVPIIAPIVSDFENEPDSAPTEPTKKGFTKDSAQLDKDGKDFARGMGHPAPDPARPEVQDFLKYCLKESLDRCAKSPAVPMIGFRVNGKIGVCYVGNEIDQCGQDTGFSEWDVAEFEKDTGIKVQRQQPTSYEWIKANCWEQWTDWRCRKTRDFWLSMRDLVKSYRNDLDLLVACDLPSETPGYNIEWVNGEPVRELFRHHGYDPNLFTNDDGISIQRGMMIASDRYFYRYGPPIGMNPWAHKAFNYAPGVAESYITKEPSSVEFYQNYWEEHPHPDGQYGGTMRTATPVAPFNYYYEPAVYSIRKVNVQRIAYMGWERASVGHEHDLRRFARTFRSLPAVEPKEFDGKVEVLKSWGALPKDKIPAHYEKPEQDVLTVNWFGDKLAVVNDSYAHKTIRLTIPRKLAAGESIMDLGAELPVVTAATAVNSVTVEIEVEPFDLQVFSIGKEPVQPAPTAPAVKQEKVSLQVSIPDNGLLAGAKETLTVSVRNNGATALKNAEVRFELPEGWWVSNPAIALGSVKPGKDVVSTVMVSVPSSALGSVSAIKVNVIHQTGAENWATQECSVVTSVGSALAVTPRDAASTFDLDKETEVLFDLTNRSCEECEVRLSAVAPQGTTASPEFSVLKLKPEEKRPVTVKVAASDKIAGWRKITLTAGWGENGFASADAMTDAIVTAGKTSKPLSFDSPGDTWVKEPGLICKTDEWKPFDNSPASIIDTLQPVAYLTWDNQNLYIRVQVKDGTHHQPYHKGAMWKGDSLQLALDLPRHENQSEGGRYVETMIALTDAGTETWMDKSLDGSDDRPANYGRYDVRREGETTVYTVILPWSELGLTVQPGTIIGFSALVNNSDGEGRVCAGWGAGIANSKDPSEYAGVKLTVE